LYNIFFTKAKLMQQVFDDLPSGRHFTSSLVILVACLCFRLLIIVTPSVFLYHVQHYASFVVMIVFVD